jgi:hypothetical protein
VKNSVKTDKIMKKSFKTILAATAAVVLTSSLSQVALANLNGNASLVNGAQNFTVASTATLESTGTYSGDYQYQYVFSGAPSALSSLSVYFNTTPANPVGITGSNDGSNLSSGAVNWLFSPGVTGATLDFYTPIAPTLGDISAQDGGLWGNGSGGEAFGVVVPNIPDGGLTVALLGGALFGLQMFRRKLVS